MRSVCSVERSNPGSLRALLPHDPEIVLGVLIEVLGFDDVTAPRCILRHRGVALIVVAGVLSRVAPLTGRADARWPLVGRAMSLRSRGVFAAMLAERLSARTLVRGVENWLGD